MGNKHPVSLRLRTKQNWGNTSYFFNYKNEQYNYWGLDKVASNIIKHYFQLALISKPRFNRESNKIIISFYYFLDSPASIESDPYVLPKIITSSSDKSEGLTANNIDLLSPQASGYSKLILKLSRFYKIPVELRPVRIHYPYLNSYILAQYMAINIKAGNSHILARNLFKRARLVKDNSTIPANLRGLIKYSPTLNGPQFLTGLKIAISGRVYQRRTASRTRVYRKSAGILNLSSTYSSIDANKYTITGKNGSVTVKVWLSSNFANSLVNN
jgi:hypothetical protein